MSSDSIDDDFPDVTFHFEDSLTLKTYPHDYLFQAQVMFIFDCHPLEAFMMTRNIFKCTNY